MLLSVDVGNTNTVVGLFELAGQAPSRAPLAHFRLETRHGRTADEYAAALKPLFELRGLAFRGPGDPVGPGRPGGVEAAIIATVVPPALFAVERLCRDHLGVRPLVVGPGLKTGMPILIDNPREVGADRVVNAVAAYERWRQGCIIVDFGTATTFDLVTPKGEYAGGAIATGIQTSGDALQRAASKLPHVEVARPAGVVGKNTVAAIQSGLYYGYVGLTDEIVTRMRREADFPCKVIATGGLAPLIAKDSRTIEEIDEMLTLAGLRILYERNR